MSKVNLPSVLFYRGDADHRPVAESLALTGIESHFPSVRFPAKGLTFLYGHRNPAIPYLLEQGGVDGQVASTIEVMVEIGTWMRQKVDLSDDPTFGLANTRFLSIKRAKKDLLKVVSEVWGRYTLRSADLGWPRESTKNPWILDHLIEHEAFKHLAVIAYEVDTQEAGCFQAATVFDLDSIVMIDGGHRLEDTEIVL